MIEFATFFLGLVLGPQSVVLDVGGEVASVEVFLDSQLVETLHGEPWELICDLGPRLVPHELVALARDADGREVARASQWINLPTQRAEARLVLEGDREGRPSRARLIWQALDHDRPQKTAVSFDGRALSAEDLDEIALPPYDPSQIHILSAELEFSDTVHARAEVVFGGIHGDRVSSELTAVVLESDRRRLPRLADLEGRLTRAGQPLRVVAVERGPLDLVVVREEALATFTGLQRLVSIGGGQRIPRRLLLPEIVRPMDRVRFVFPAREVAGDSGRFDLVPVSDDVNRDQDDPLFNLLAGLTFGEHDRAVARQRVADAVSVAGLVAARGNRRRAVLLLTSGESVDVSRLPPPLARHYLNGLGVPLIVWSLADPARPEAVEVWGEVTRVVEWPRLEQAFKRLERSLDSQLVVWVEGRHLPQEIALDGSGDDLRLARRDTPELEAQLAALPPDPLAPRTSAGAPVSDTLPAAADGSRVAAADIRRIEQARVHMSGEQVPGRLGSFDLLTDHFAPRLLKRLDRLAVETPRLYGEHHGLPVTVAAGGTVILFRHEDDFRAYEEELGVGGLELAGHATASVVTLYAGRRDSRAVEATFVHELVHLLNLRTLGPELPPWLDEGLAEEMALARIRPQGELAFVPLDARSLRVGHRTVLSGPLSVLDELIDALTTAELPSLPTLLELDREGFRRSPSRRLLYALFAFWVHYLASADAETAAGFHDYLAEVAAAGDAEKVSLTESLGHGWETLEPGFHEWLRRLAERVRPPLAGGSR